MNKSDTLDMMRGKPIALLVRFAIPLMLGSMFQQLYSFVDTAIVGRCVSVQALSAVGVTSPLNFLVLGFLINCAVGFCIPISQSVGAGSKDEVSRYFWNGLYLCLALGLLFSVGTGPLAMPMLRMLNTPAELLEMAASYLSIVFYGELATILYNYLAGAIRAFGDSKRPFYFLLVGTGVNLILDILLVAVIPMGVMGAALATVISQAFSVFLCVWWFSKMQSLVRLRSGQGLKLFGISFDHLKRICFVGLPLGLEASVCSIGNLILQSSINTLGTVAATAQTCAERIRFILTLPMESMGSAMATYVGQNYGARKLDRIREGVRSGLAFQIIYSISAWFLLFFLKRPFVYLLLGNEAPVETAATLKYLSIISTLFVFHGSLMVFRYAVQGMGYGATALFSAVMEIIGRSVAGFTAVRYNNFTLICLSSPIAWILALIYCASLYRYYVKRESLEWDER